MARDTKRWNKWVVAAFAAVLLGIGPLALSDLGAEESLSVATRASR